ncbi:hypothetical protein MCEMSE18_00093 [Candidatus Planktophila versatilis]|uniref:hypothetical protein n=1 Tax=Candidatus Planktophila versatilis TaxID=1884905 RepID=UPI003BEED2D0
MPLIRVILELIRRPKNFLNAFQLIGLMIKIKRIIPNNSSKISINPDTDVTLNDLSTLLLMHGSDKSSKHNYDEFYFRFLRDIKNNPGLVVEIGIGTNNPLIPSTMGISGTPGASLRAFRDFLPNMQIIGADIDREILFTEERIETFYLDQKKINSFIPMLNQIQSMDSGGVDFVVIDGLHQALTDLNSVWALLPYLKVGARLFIEDVFPDSTNKMIWTFAKRVFNDKYFVMTMHRTKLANLIEIERLN